LSDIFHRNITRENAVESGKTGTGYLVRVTGKFGTQEECDDLQRLDCKSSVSINDNSENLFVD